MSLIAKNRLVQSMFYFLFMGHVIPHWTREPTERGTSFVFQKETSVGEEGRGKEN